MYYIFSHDFNFMKKFICLFVSGMATIATMQAILIPHLLFLNPMLVSQHTIKFHILSSIVHLFLLILDQIIMLDQNISSALTILLDQINSRDLTINRGRIV